MTQPVRTIALVAHDATKDVLLEWATHNRATADLLVTSPLLTDPAYVRQVPDHTAHRQRLRSGP